MATPATPIETTRPLRVDAQRNRRRVLDEAERLFAGRGPSVKIDDVATAAGVGVGTVCRHFPTKADLLAAVIERLYTSLVDDAQRALEDPDPVLAFEGFVYGLAEVQARRSAIAESIPATPPSISSSLRQALRTAVGELVHRAQAAGGIRHDVSGADVLVLLAGIAHVATVAQPLSEPLRRRAVALVLDGLRPEGASSLPGRPLVPRDLDRLRRP